MTFTTDLSAQIVGDIYFVFVYVSMCSMCSSLYVFMCLCLYEFYVTTDLSAQIVGDIYLCEEIGKQGSGTLIIIGREGLLVVGKQRPENESVLIHFIALQTQEAFIRRVYIHKYMHTYICVCIYTYIHTYIHTYVCMYIYIYIYIKP